MDKLSNKRAIVIVVSVLVIIGLVGVTYAFFTGVVNGNEGAKGTAVETGTLSIKYTNSNELRGTNVMPGWTETKTFTVENTGTVKATYNINWNNLLNEFINKEDLVYTITSDNNGGVLTETILPDSGEHLRIISNIDIEPGVIQTYTLTVTYKNRDADQTNDNNKKLVGKIEVFDVNEDNSVLSGNASNTLIAKYSEDNTEGLIKIAQPATVQTKESIEYRYSGSNDVVKNYVNFNNETWRIIGIFDVDDGTEKIEKRVKIIRDESIGNYSWDSSISTINYGLGSNQWGPTGSYPGADLMTELNDLYYNSKSGTCYNGENNASTTCDFTTTGLKEKSRNMISNAKWYTGVGAHQETIKVTYRNERSNTIGPGDDGQSINKTSNWIGKISLMHLSDYGYASSDCYNKNYALSSYDRTECINSNWLLNSDYELWTLTPHRVYNRSALIICRPGYAGNNLTYNSYSIRPTLYLKPSVKIISGSGTKNDMYELSL